LSVILKAISIVGEELDQLNFDAKLAKFRLGVEAYLEKLDCVK